MVDAKHTNDHAIAIGAQSFEEKSKVLDVPAIIGIGGSLIYTFDKYYDQSVLSDEFDWLDKAHPQGECFYYLGHLTHNNPSYY